MSTKWMLHSSKQQREYLGCSREGDSHHTLHSASWPFADGCYENGDSKSSRVVHVGTNNLRTGNRPTTCGGHRTRLPAASDQYTHAVCLISTQTDGFTCTCHSSLFSVPQQSACVSYVLCCVTRCHSSDPAEPTECHLFHLLTDTPHVKATAHARRM